MDIEGVWKRDGGPVWLDGNPWTLSGLVDDFIRRRTDPRSPLHVNRDDVVDWCAEAPQLRVAITRACNSRRPNGKLHNHQSRVKEHARDKLAVRMRADRSLRTVDSFELLHDRILSYDIAGIGPVTVYDVATRVGAYLGLHPVKLHLHAGVLQGLRELRRAGALHGVYWDKVRSGDWVKMSLLPRPLASKLSADEVEDFLCTYRNVLGKVTKEAAPDARIHHRTQAGRA